MSERLHIIVTGDRGKVLRLPCCKKKLSYILICSAVTLLFLLITSIFSISLFTKNRTFINQVADLKDELRQKSDLIAQHQRVNEEQRLKLDLKVANLELNNKEQASAFREEKENLISNAVSELTERSELIERIIGSIGIKIPEVEKDGSKNSGGLFIEKPSENSDALIYKADKYLNAIRYLPFGRPVKSPISSRFGKRKDPFNKRTAFHTGIDFRGKRGEKVYATADGTVKKAFRNGGHGNYILIDHGNGYTTSFSHLNARLVSKGERVERGQLIGLVGNTGRSTGPHLHYEIALDKKPINPYNFMKISKLFKNPSSSVEKK